MVFQSMSAGFWPRLLKLRLNSLMTSIIRRGARSSAYFVQPKMSSIFGGGLRFDDVWFTGTSRGKMKSKLRKSTDNGTGYAGQ